MNKCILCSKRKGRRYCKALAQWICPECCGEKRFRKINCLKDCVYLKKAQDYSSERIIEIFPTWKDEKLWILLNEVRFSTYKFIKENPNFSDDEYEEVIELLIKEYEVQLKNLLLPQLLPKSSRGVKLKIIIENTLKNLLGKVNEFGFPIFSIEDVVEILTWEREKVEEYQRNNKNLGADFFLQNLKLYIEKLQNAIEKESPIIYP